MKILAIIVILLLAIIAWLFLPREIRFKLLADSGDWGCYYIRKLASKIGQEPTLQLFKYTVSKRLDKLDTLITPSGSTDYDDIERETHIIEQLCMNCLKAFESLPAYDGLLFWIRWQIKLTHDRQPEKVKLTFEGDYFNFDITENPIRKNLRQLLSRL